LITRPEFMRRMKEMQFAQGKGADAFGDFYNVVVNTNHPLVGKLSEDRNEDLAKHLYQLALLQQGLLRGNDLTAFIKKSVDIMK
jgi:molecular chaperone HtpG